jgi:hypothetical protein
MIKKIRNFLTSVKDGLENLIIWFSIIWQDRDWDHYYLYQILRKKLINMEIYHRKYGHSVNSTETAFEIKKCILLLNRLIDDNYDELVFKKHHKKWGEPIFNWNDCKDKKDCYSLRIEQKNVKTDKDKKQESKEFERLCKHINMLKKQDIEYLFKLMNKHIQTWWD